MQHMSSSWCCRCYPHRCATSSHIIVSTRAGHGQPWPISLQNTTVPKKWMCLYEGQFQPLVVHQLFSKQVPLSWNWLSYGHKRLKVASICIISSRALHSTCWFRSSLEAPGCIMIYGEPYLDACSLESASIWWMLAIVLAAIQFESVLITPVCQPEPLEILKIWILWRLGPNRMIQRCVLSKRSEGFELFTEFVSRLWLEGAISPQWACVKHEDRIYIYIRT